MVVRDGQSRPSASLAMRLGIGVFRAEQTNMDTHPQAKRLFGKS